ncbi:MAG: hypothetical protein HOW73_43465 [Polyangiaceae bacterium]|nr:hypothetical protein [Polyangiaceae bacterium]
MKPVDQTTFGHPGGNCFSACVASLLDLSIDAVPYFMGHDDWYRAFNEWLAPRGYHALTFQVGDWVPPADAVLILGGQSPRGAHAVVARGLTVVHDPHPSRDGLVVIEDATFLIPLTPYV